MTIDQQHWYSNKSERANQNILYDDFKIKMALFLFIYIKYLSALTL